MKVADVKLNWKKSISADIEKVVLTVTVDGTETVTELGKDVEEFMIVMNANGTCQFSVDTFDSEGLHTTSTVYTFTLGDLEAPQPATDLFHEVVGVRDIPDA